VGDDRNRKERPDLSRGIWGARASITVQPVSKWTFGSGLSYQNSRYASDFAVEIAPRRDDFFAFDLSATYPIDRNWAVRTEYQRIERMPRPSRFPGKWLSARSMLAAMSWPSPNSNSPRHREIRATGRACKPRVRAHNLMQVLHNFRL
jgi:hypothetical protein